MSSRLALIAAAVFTLAAPAFAQEGTAPAAAVQGAPSAEVRAFEIKAEAFTARLAQLQSELETAIAAAGGDQSRGMAAVEAIIARYEPEIDAFVPELESFFDAQIAIATSDEQKVSLAESKADNSLRLRGMVQHIRTFAPDFIAAGGRS